MKESLRHRATGLLAILIFAVSLTGAQGQTELIQNGGFESGSGTNIPGWNVSGLTQIGTPNDDPTIIEVPHTGWQFLNLAGPATGSGSATQTITVPSDPTKVTTLTFWEAAFTRASLPGTTTDFDEVVLVVNGVTKTSDYLGGNVNVYRKHTYDLSAYKGMSVQINFYSATDGQFVFDFDDVSVLVTTPQPGVTNLSPNPMEPMNAVQTLTIKGSNFITGDTLTFIDPNGVTSASVASKLTVNSSNQLSYQFNNASNSGVWTLTVNSPDGTQQSAATNFLVAFPPAITNIVPNVMQPKNGSQSFILQGSNFVNNQTVTLISPDGIHQTGIATTLTGTTNSSSSINNTNKGGTWQAMIVSADKKVQSLPVNFTVRYPTPSLSDIVASPLAPYNGFQPVTLNGGNFEPGVTLSFVSPNGEMLSNTVVSNLVFGFATQGTFLFNNLGESGTWKLTAYSVDGLSQSADFNFPVMLRVPKFTPFSAMLSGTNMVMLASTQYGWDYVWEYRDTLQDTTWIPVKTNAGLAAHSTIFTNSTTGQERYFRLLVRPRE